MEMEKIQYLSPSIAMAMPKLDEQLDQLMQEALKKGVAAHIKKKCESDPELADIINEEKKTLPRCIRYVLEKAQKHVATNVEAMLESEFDQLAQTKVRGVMATMAGSAVSEEQIYTWADEYLYGGTAVEPSDAKKTGGTTAKKSAGPATKGGKGKGGAAASKKADTAKDNGTGTTSGKPATNPVPAAAKNPNEMAGGTQISLDDLSPASNDSMKPAA